MLRKVVDGEVTPNVCVHVGDLVVAAKDKEAFERDKTKGVVKMTQTAFVDSLTERIDIQYESQTPATVEFDLRPKRSDKKREVGLTSRRSVVYCGSRR